MTTTLNWSISIIRCRSPFSIDMPTQSTIDCNDVSDINATFVADPFLINHYNKWFVFYEVMNKDTGLGEIGLSESIDGKYWDYRQIVLKENFHLSYPLVFKHGGHVYMMPECLEPNAIRIYRATKFPYEWELHNEIIVGQFADPTIFRHNNKWWILVCPSFNTHDQLSVYYSNKMEGPWNEHDLNPIIENDPTRSRPGGRVINSNGRLVRFAQDCTPYYGTRLRALEITKLSPSKFEEREIDGSPLLNPSGDGWNKDGMHHMDAIPINQNNWVVAMDGFYITKE